MLYWLTSIAALIGVWLNIKKHVACFWIWSLTNAVWVYADIEHGIILPGNATGDLLHTGYLRHLPVVQGKGG